MKKVFLTVSIMFCLFAQQQVQQVTHIVKEGDTLWDIAGFYYQNPFLWPYIWRANLEKISDPHWIYPEQQLLVPPVPETTMAAESIPIAPPETMVLAPAETIPPEGPETIYYAPPPTKEEIEVSFIAPEERIFSEELVRRVGYIAEEELIPFGSIIKSEPEYKQIASFMKVYIEYGANEVKVGDVYVIYRLGDDISHPVTGQHYGRLVEILGLLKVEDVAEGGARAIVTVSHDVIKPGDLLMPYVKFDIPTKITLKQTERLVEGFVVYVKSKTPLTMNHTVAFIDQGTNNEIMAGDVFRIYEKKEYGGRVLPDLIVAELVVVSPKANTSACLVSWRRLNTKVEPKDKIRLQMEAR